MVICAVRSFETGQFAFAAPAAFSNASCEAPGILATTVR